MYSVCMYGLQSQNGETIIHARLGNASLGDVGDVGGLRTYLVDLTIVGSSTSSGDKN